MLGALLSAGLLHACLQQFAFPCLLEPIQVRYFVTVKFIHSASPCTLFGVFFFLACRPRSVRSSRRDCFWSAARCSRARWTTCSGKRVSHPAWHARCVHVFCFCVMRNGHEISRKFPGNCLFWFSSFFHTRGYALFLFPVGVGTLVLGLRFERHLPWIELPALM